MEMEIGISDLSAAILRLSPGAKYTIRGTNLDTDLVWEEGQGDRPTNEDIIMMAEDILTEQAINWTGLLKKFLEPGNALYESCLAKAIAAGELAYHRFSNLQQVISNQELRSPAAIAYGIDQLNGALTGANALDADEKSAWNSLIDTYNLPSYCKIPV